MRDNGCVNENTMQQLRLIEQTGTKPFAETAGALVNGELHWSNTEIEQFIDGFMNDPYLTRNN